jgi:competence protein ComFC
MIKKLIDFCLDFLFPKKCLLCEEEGSYLCFKCFKSVKRSPLRCPGCKKESKNGGLCNYCKYKFSFEGVLSLGDFKDKKLNLLIRKYKYGFIKDLGEVLGELLFLLFINNAKKNPILKREGNLYLFEKEEELVLIPVPLSKERFRWRGFNQSLVLCRYVSKRSKIRLQTDMIKIKNKKSQVGLSKKERMINNKNLFKWKGSSLKDIKVIVVDDVYTTGSTLNEIAIELKKHQAKEVWGLVIARS